MPSEPMDRKLEPKKPGSAYVHALCCKLEYVRVLT